MMKAALQLCALALNPAAPSPTANMVKIEDGFMSSFGGLFCIRVPMPVEVGACFAPGAVSTFFRKEREAVSYTLHKKRLVLKEGKEKLSVPCLPPEEMVTLDVLAKPYETALDTKHFKSLADVIDPANQRMWAQGVSFRYGMAESTNNAVIVSAVTDLPDSMEFNIPVDSIRAILKFKSRIARIAHDERAVKFYFEDGSSLTTQVLTEQMIETSQFYAGEWEPLRLQEHEDLLKVPCSAVSFRDGNVIYQNDTTEGVIEGVVNKGYDVTVGKSSLDHLLRISGDIRISADSGRLMAVSETCRAISSVRAK